MNFRPSDLMKRFLPRWKKVPSPLRLRSRVWRRDRWYYVGAVFLAGVLYFYRVPAKHEPRRTTPPSPAVSATVPGVVPRVEPKVLPSASVLEVVDGDTLKIVWDGKPVFLRYFGVDTPERDQPCYAQATDRNRQLAGGVVLLAFDERVHDQHGRLLAYVFTKEGFSVDGTLIREGLGKAWKADGRFRDELIRLEEEARHLREGCLNEGETPR